MDVGQTERGGFVLESDGEIQTYLRERERWRKLTDTIERESWRDMKYKRIKGRSKIMKDAGETLEHQVETS